MLYIFIHIFPLKVAERNLLLFLQSRTRRESALFECCLNPEGRFRFWLHLRLCREVRGHGQAQNNIFISQSTDRLCRAEAPLKNLTRPPSCRCDANARASLLVGRVIERKNGQQKRRRDYVMQPVPYIEMI